MNIGIADIPTLIHKQIERDPRRKPSRCLVPERLDISEPVKSEQPRITWFGHSAFLLQMDGKNILLDPMFSKSPSPFQSVGPQRFSDSLPATIDELPHIDLVIISHDHYDHLDYDSIKKLAHKTTMFFVPLGLAAHLRKWGVKDSQISELDWWDERTAGGFTLTCTPSRHFSGRRAGEPPPTLIDYLPSDALMFIDESHVTIGQVGGMFKGDRSRKENLVDYGFRLPSALDNRPLQFSEFEAHLRQTIFVSATPADYENRHAGQVVEQVVRPTGLIDPLVIVRPASTQVDDLLTEIKSRVDAGERVLVTTLTKRMAEDLTDFLAEHGIKVRYLHSDIDTVERVEIIRDLRLGEFDVLVGINLLREGLDIPEVSLVAILDADKEGFLRSERSLIQTIGRAARHINGTAILYADTITQSMQRAIAETERRREKQIGFNAERGITPRGVSKKIKDIIDGVYDVESVQSELKAAQQQAAYEAMDEKTVAREIKRLEKLMLECARNLEFEKAAAARDDLFRLRERVFGAAQHDRDGDETK